MWNECVIDASMGARDGLFTFCPIEGDINDEYSVVTGMNYISAAPPRDMKLVAIIHPDGEEAVNQFCDDHREALDRLRNKCPFCETPYSQENWVCDNLLCKSKNA